MLLNPYQPGTDEFNKHEALKAMRKLDRIQKNPTGEVADLQDFAYGNYGSMLSKISSMGGQQEMFGRPLYQMRYMADGGEIAEDMMPEGEALLAPTGEEMSGYDESFTTSMEFPALADVLGDDRYMELESAMAKFPVVREVAEMATYQADGYVEGQGGPTSDDVPARLSDGEYVFSAAAVQAIGLENLERMHEEAKAVAAATI